MRITPHHNNLNHARLPATRRRQRLMQLHHITLHKSQINPTPFDPAPLLQGQQNRRPEFIRLQLGFHAFLQIVAVFFVLEAVLDLADVGVRSTHQTLDEEFAPHVPALVEGVGPEGFAFPAAERRRVHDFAEVARDARLDVFRDVDPRAADFGVVFVLCAEGEEVVAGEEGEDLHQGFGVRGFVGPCQGGGDFLCVGLWVVEDDGAAASFARGVGFDGRDGDVGGGAVVAGAGLDDGFLLREVFAGFFFLLFLVTFLLVLEFANLAL